jgi:hypothetical protein
MPPEFHKINKETRVGNVGCLELLCPHVLAQLNDYDLDFAPFPHLVIDGFFPPEDFSRLCECLPPTKDYLRLERPEAKDDGLGERAILPLDRERLKALIDPARSVLSALSEGLCDRAVVCKLLEKFDLPRRDERLRQGMLRPTPQAILSRDFGPYEIGPHTDIPQRLISVILYLSPQIESKEYGTALFMPHESGKNCSKGLHYTFQDFSEAKVVEFRPNRALLFARSDISFHGLPPFSAAHGARDTLLYEVALRLPSMNKSADCNGGASSPFQQDCHQSSLDDY